MRRRREIRRCLLTFGIALVFSVTNARGAVLFEEGGHIIEGIQVLRDSADPGAYYYIPTSPRVSTTEDGTPEMYIVKFVDAKSDVAGGLIHFLFSLDLAPEVLADIEMKLRQKVPGASLRGPVPLLTEWGGDGDQPKPSFRIISSILTDPAEGSFTQTLIASGIAPVTPGSKAAVAARLNEHGATLLFSSIEEGGSISDISVAITAYYEAAVRGYRGTVRADINTVYEHMFNVENRQAGYSKHEVRELTDDLLREGVIDVEVTDRAGLDLDSSAMSNLMDLVTSKLIDMLFDTTQGLSALPEYETVPANQVPAHRHRSWINRTFGGNSNPKYRTDDQYTLRNRTDIRRGFFSLSFTQNTTIKVPFNTAGNMRGLYQAWKPENVSDNNPQRATFNRLFRVVDLSDPDFERRQIYFEIDPGYYELFDTTINGVYLTFVKEYGDEHAPFTDEIVFTQKDVRDGTFSKYLSYPRLGIDDLSWLGYGMRERWSFRGGRSVEVPGDTELKSDNAAYVALAPPGELLLVEIYGDEAELVADRIMHAEVTLEYRYLDKKGTRRVSLRPGFEELSKTVSLLYDTGSDVSYRIRWTRDGGERINSDRRVLDSGHLEITAPSSGS
jgi:hypothetical protein